MYVHASLKQPSMSRCNGIHWQCRRRVSLIAIHNGNTDTVLTVYWQGRIACLMGLTQPKEAMPWWVFSYYTCWTRSNRKFNDFKNTWHTPLGLRGCTIYQAIVCIVLLTICVLTRKSFLPNRVQSAYSDLFIIARAASWYWDNELFHCYPFNGRSKCIYSLYNRPTI